MRLRRFAQKLEVHVLRREKPPQLAPERIVADLADQGRRGTEPCRGNGLMGARAAGEKEHLPSHNGLSNLRMPRGSRDNIHVDAAGDPDMHGRLLMAA